MKKNAVTEISVIIPIYNIECYLLDCLDSVLSQTFDSYEVILVDDGSADASGIMSDFYSINYSNVRVIHKQNGGLSSARNAGYQLSVGNYVAFIDGDDYIRSDMMEKMFSSVQKYGADLVICNYSEVGQNRKFLKNSKILEEGLVPKEEILKKRMFENGCEVYSITWNKLYRRNLFDGVIFPKGKQHEDEFVFHEIYSKCQRVFLLKDSLYYYRQREGSITNSNWTIRRLDFVEAYLLRAEAYNNYIGFEKAALETLNNALNAYEDYYNKVSWRLNDAHRIRNKELQKLYCNAVAPLLVQTRVPRKYVYLMMMKNFHLGNFVMEKINWVLSKRPK